jgi:S-adenosylmethionine synthetase
VADRCEVNVAYAIGVAHPVSIAVQTFNTGAHSGGPDRGARAQALRPPPGGDPARLELQRPIYRKTAAYGHFGREDRDFTWERTARPTRCARRPG